MQKERPDLEVDSFWLYDDEVSLRNTRWSDDPSQVFVRPLLQVTIDLLEKNSLVDNGTEPRSVNERRSNDGSFVVVKDRPG
ncbi:MAG TPA: hypothetical protein VF121_05195 [Thermoanaerobaculia bacterium]|nr:hypothetical protein [Thermoanaerobaculia bacterium]